MPKSVAIIGAGVSGVTCGVVFAERGFRTAIFAQRIGQRTTSGAAAALWFPYDAQPADKVIPWALATYKVLVDLTKDPRSGVSMIELRQYCRTGQIQIPDWAALFVISTEVEKSLTISASIFKSGFSLNVPLMYAIPRTNDCVFGGTNEVSDNLEADPVATKAIVSECAQVLKMESPRVLRERVGLRPFRKSGVRLEAGKLSDSRTVIHNYGHGGSGFTLSWGCAENVFE